MEDLTALDRSDPLNLIINNPNMDESDSNAAPPDWSELNALWAEESTSTTTTTTTTKPILNDFLDFNMASNILDTDMDMSLTGIEPSALHLGASEARLAYPSYDDPFSFPASVSPADILAAQFPFTFNDLTSCSGLETPNIKQRRLSITSSSSSSGPSFSPVPESIPSPGSFQSHDSTNTHHTTPDASMLSQSNNNSGSTTPNSPVIPDFSGDPAAELAHRVRQSAGVMLAVPMNTYQSSTNAASALQTKLPIPRLQRPGTTTSSPPSKSSTPSVTSSAPSTPPPSTPTITSPSSIPNSTATTSSIVQPNGAKPKTSHTTIERRYRTNLNARIQSLRMAVPALRVLEDRDSGGSSKKIKKNLKTGVLIKTATAGGGTALSAYTTSSSSSAGGNNNGGGAAALNPYGEIDVIDERGYVDGVKVARKCSKANVLGKAVEYIRVLKRREIRLRNEQDGLKALINGLVGGPALLKEWEREWRERFGGEERDEVAYGGCGGDLDEEGDDEDDEDEDEDEGEMMSGKKRKRAKVEKDTLPLPNLKKEGKPVILTTTMDGQQTEKRKRGRPRKTPLAPSSTSTATPAAAPTSLSMPIQHHHQQQPQQYLLAVFALFSFFNSPLTSSSPSSGVHHHHSTRHHGHVLSPPPVPLVFAPEIVSHFDTPNPPPPPMMSTVGGMTWRDWVQIVHLGVTIMLFVGVITRMGGKDVIAKLRRRIVGGKSRRGEEEDEKEEAKKFVEKIILGREPVPASFASALALYQSLSLTDNNNIITCALFLYTLASSARNNNAIPMVLKPILRMRARSLWSSSSLVQDEKKYQVVLASSIEDVYNILRTNGMEKKNSVLVDVIAERLIRRKLGNVLAKLFIRQVSGTKDKEVEMKKKGDDDDVEKEGDEEEDVELVLDAAKELGGQVGILARKVERMRVVNEEQNEEEDEESEEEDDDEDSSVLYETDDEGEVGEEGEEEEGKGPNTILRALVLYRSLFSSMTDGCSTTTTTMAASTTGLGLFTTPLRSPPMTISIEPPTPTPATITIPDTPMRRRCTTGGTFSINTNHNKSSTSMRSLATTRTRTKRTDTRQRRKMYVLRKLLGSRVFERGGDDGKMEDARDRVVDMLVDAERRGTLEAAAAAAGCVVV